MNAPHILMCPPDHYDVVYEINPWMHRKRQTDQSLAAEQWRRLRELVEALGAAVSLVPPHPGLPDLVFTANAALVYRDRAILAQFRHEERRGEEPHFAQWLAEHGFQVERLPEGMFFEGAGDALFCGETLLAGYRIRSDVRALTEIGRRLSCRVIPLELVDRHFYHLDTCLCPLAPGQAIYWPGAFDDYGRRALAAAVDELIPVSEEEAQRFACNAAVVGQTVITNTGCPRLHDDLRARGFSAIETPLSEFLKAGGSAKCLTLRLDGEEAAAWKQKPVAAQ